MKNEQALYDNMVGYMQGSRTEDSFNDMLFRLLVIWSLSKTKEQGKVIAELLKIITETK